MFQYSSASSRKKNQMIRGTVFATFLINCFCAALYSVSYGTQSWITCDLNNTLDPTGTGDAKFGLFAGEANLFIKSKDTKVYRIVCLNGQCMFSAGKTKAEREDSLIQVENGTSPPPQMDGGRHPTKLIIGDQPVMELQFLSPINWMKPIVDEPKIIYKSDNSTVSDSVPELMNEGLWIATIISLSAGLLFAVVGAVFAVINTATTPIETVTGIPGLYVWNMSAAFFALLSIILWAVQYHLHLMNNVLIEDEAEGWTTEGFEHLGYSFWLVLVAMFLHTLNCILIFIATYEKKAKTQYEAPETKPGNSMLY